MKKNILTQRAEKVSSLRAAISSEPTLRTRMGFNSLPIAQVDDAVLIMIMVNFVTAMMFVVNEQVKYSHFE